jgi:hypothetical protein
MDLSAAGEYVEPNGEGGGIMIIWLLLPLLSP